MGEGERDRRKKGSMRGENNMHLLYKEQRESVAENKDGGRLALEVCEQILPRTKGGLEATKNMRTKGIRGKKRD